MATAVECRLRESMRRIVCMTDVHRRVRTSCWPRFRVCRQGTESGNLEVGIPSGMDGRLAAGRAQCTDGPSLSNSPIDIKRPRSGGAYGDNMEALVISLFCLEPVRSQQLDVAVLRQQFLRKRCSQKAQRCEPETLTVFVSS